MTASSSTTTTGPAATPLSGTPLAALAGPGSELRAAGFVHLALGEPSGSWRFATAVTPMSGFGAAQDHDAFRKKDAPETSSRRVARVAARAAKRTPARTGERKRDDPERALNPGVART